jgi:hypothetical protein
VWLLFPAASSRPDTRRGGGVSATISQRAYPPVPATATNPWCDTARPLISRGGSRAARAAAQGESWPAVEPRHGDARVPATATTGAEASPSAVGGGPRGSGGSRTCTALLDPRGSGDSRQGLAGGDAPPRRWQAPKDQRRGEPLSAPAAVTKILFEDGTDGRDGIFPISLIYCKSAQEFYGFFV